MVNRVVAKSLLQANIKLATSHSHWIAQNAEWQDVLDVERLRNWRVRLHSQSRNADRPKATPNIRSKAWLRSLSIRSSIQPVRFANSLNGAKINMCRNILWPDSPTQNIVIDMMPGNEPGEVPYAAKAPQFIELPATPIVATAEQRTRSIPAASTPPILLQQDWSQRV